MKKTLVLLACTLLGAAGASAQSIQQRVTALETRVAAMEKGMPPVGSIIAVALTPAQVAALKPFWVPANGSVVADQQSPLNGVTLPNLTGRFLVGLDPAKNSADNAANVGGGEHLGANVVINAATQGMVVRNCTPFMHEARLAFAGGNAAVNDTPIDESACDHTHALNVTAGIDAAVPLPPFRAVVYLVRVR